MNEGKPTTAGSLLLFHLITGKGRRIHIRKSTSPPALFQYTWSKPPLR